MGAAVQRCDQHLCVSVDLIIILGRIDPAALAVPGISCRISVLLGHVSSALRGSVGHQLETAVAIPDRHAVEADGLKVINLALLDQADGFYHICRCHFIKYADFIIFAPLAPVIVCKPGIISVFIVI